jgi:hypothetical protein
MLEERAVIGAARRGVELFGDGVRPPAAVPPAPASAGDAVAARAMMLRNVALMVRSGKTYLSSACGVS